jgi:hypothetical protein
MTIAHPRNLWLLLALALRAGDFARARELLAELRTRTKAKRDEGKVRS